MVRGNEEGFQNVIFLVFTFPLNTSEMNLHKTSLFTDSRGCMLKTAQKCSGPPQTFSQDGDTRQQNEYFICNISGNAGEGKEQTSWSFNISI